MLRTHDRKILSETLAAARDARRPPQTLGEAIEPIWAVTIAQSGVPITTAVFRHGDREDAVRSAWAKLAGRGNPEELTLYLTLEPRPTYQRIQPVTESIRATGIRRIIVGTEDPFLRERGHGIRALRNYGLEVILADGEEARGCQLLYEDYAKAMNRFVPALRLVCELKAEAAERFSVQTISENIPGIFDGVLIDLNSTYRKDIRLPEQGWVVVMDSFAGLPLDSQIVKEMGKRMVVCTANTPEVEPKATAIRKAGIRTISVPLKNGAVDLGLVLRKLRELGFYSVYCAEGKELWRSAIQSGLVDSILCHVRKGYDPVRTLSELAKSRLELPTGSEPVQFRLVQPRWLMKSEPGFWVEAEIVEYAPAQPFS